MTWMESVLGRFWPLLETLGWWILLGLLLGWLLQLLPPGKAEKRFRRIPAAALLGAALPMCNFGAIPVAVSLLARGTGTGVSLAFLAGASLLNPAGLLLAWAYLGPKLAAAYALSAAAVSLLAGAAGERWGQTLPRRQADARLAAEGILWLMLGIAAQGAALGAFPSLWRRVIGNPAAVSCWEAAAAGALRHVCIPDDISLAASLTASGLRPGWTVLLLLMGVSTNLPELFVLYGTAGGRNAGIYLLTMASGSFLAAVLTQLALGAGFVPQFNLANAAFFERLAGLLSIRTWMPAKIPCACALVLLFGWALWYKAKKWFDF